ncbi:MAG: YggS family pyridoxal phosphate-dependent enzyme [Armatimonadota bacterium]
MLKRPSMQAGKSMHPPNRLSEHWYAIQERIAHACARVGRDPDTIRIVAVSKGVPVAQIEQAWQMGQRDFGENYWQEAREKIPQLPTDIRWHFIGHLQSNKVKYVTGRFRLIQSVDRLSLLQEIQKTVSKLGIIQPILIEVRLSEEATRAGAPIEQVPDLVEHALQMPNVALQGVMGLAPYTESVPCIRKAFQTLRRLYESLPESNRVWLSMGMSHDFEVALEEGSNMLRIGTALFGERRRQGG